MPCYYPVTGYQSAEFGGALQFDPSLVKHDFREIVVPCGRCFGCRLERSKMWAVRCMHESQMHDASSFVTLTYSDDHLPVNGSLNYKDFQDFMKRLRKRYGAVRYYMCGEYGETTWRPHFHALLFGLYFEDRKFFKTSAAGHRLYVSDALNKLWPFGENNLIGDVTFESAAYCARYVIKKVNGDRALEHYTRVDPRTGEVVQLTPEFAHMSLKPGIGAPWFAKFRHDVFNGSRDAVVVRGREMKPPKYYDKLLKAVCDELGIDDDDYSKFVRASRPVNEDDNREVRLRVREKVARAKVGFFARSLGE